MPTFKRLLNPSGFLVISVSHDDIVWQVENALSPPNRHFNKMVPDFRELGPSNIPVEQGIGDSDVDSFLHTSLKPLWFYCQDLGLL